MEYTSLLSKLTPKVWKLSSRIDKVFFILCLLVAGIFAYGVITGVSFSETTLIESVDIYSLSLNDNAEFSFILGTGSSDFCFRYYFFKDWDDGKVLDFVDASVTKVVETDEQHPSLKRYENIRYFAFYSKNLSWNGKGVCYNELTVPMNTTQTSFTAEA